jgi:glycosyltransferase 2 family protein
MALSVFFLWLSLRGANFAEIAHALARSQLVYALPLVLALALFYWFKAVRIRLLLMPMRDVQVQGVLPATMIGFAANNLLPARLGDLVRAYLLGRQYNLRKTSLLATMVLERLFDLVAALGLLALIFIGMRVPATLVRPGYFIGGLELVLLCILIMVIMQTGTLVRFCLRVTGFFPGTLQSWLTRHIEHGAAGTRALKQPYLLAGIATTSVAQAVLRATAMYLALLAVGTDVPPSAALVLLALSTAAITLPSAPGFFGTMQLCFVLALKPYGIAPADAFAASLFYQALEYVAVTGAGFYFLKDLDQGLGKIRENAELSTDVAEVPASR